MKKLILAAWILVIAGPAFGQELRIPGNNDRARWTMGDMVAWRTALDAYRIDHGSYPVVSTLEDLRLAVVPKYMVVAPLYDAWGRPYRYESTGDGYRFVSSGADGRFEPESWPVSGRLRSLSEDAVATHEGDWLHRSWPWSLE